MKVKMKDFNKIHHLAYKISSAPSLKAHPCQPMNKLILKISTFWVKLTPDTPLHNQAKRH